MSPVAEDRKVVSVRDVTDRAAADRDRRVLLESAMRQREQARKVAAFGTARGAVDADLPGVDLDLWSVPSRQGTATGSDVVDVSRMPDGRIALLLVDALDAGGLSADEAWQVLYVARALLFAGVPLTELVDQSARTLHALASPPRASLLAGTMDPGTGVVAVACGGHPPPLLVHANGRCEWLAAQGSPLGTGAPGPNRAAEGLLAPGDRLILYTDGLVDGSRDLLEGLSALRSAASARRSLGGAEWSRGLLAAMLPNGSADDATVLTVRRRAGPGAA